MTPQERLYACDICHASMPRDRWLVHDLCLECQSIENLDRRAIAAGLVDPVRLAELKKREKKP